MFENLLTAGAAVTALTLWVGLCVAAGPIIERNHPGRIARVSLWVIFVGSAAGSVIYNVSGAAGLGDLIFNVGSLAVPAYLVGAACAVLSQPAKSTVPVVGPLLLALAAVQVTSTVLAGQVGQVGNLVLAGLAYLPCLVILFWKAPGPLDRLRPTLLAMALVTVYGSLVLVVVNVDASQAQPLLDRRLPLGGDYAYRIRGITPHPNILAFIAAIGIVLMLERKVRLRLVHIAACVAASALAEARTLTVALGVALVLYAIFTARSSRLWRAMTVGALGMAGALAFGGRVMQTLASSDLESDLSNFHDRSTVWTLVGTYWPQKPFMGWGAFVFDDRTHSPLSVLYFNNAHNQFLEALIETGLVGLALLGLALLALVVAAMRCTDGVFIAATTITGLFSMTEVPLTLHNYGFNFVIVMSAIVLAVLVPGPQERPARSAPQMVGRLASKNAESTA